MSEVTSSIFSKCMQLKWTLNISVILFFKVNTMVSVPFPHIQLQRETKQGQQSVLKRQFRLLWRIYPWFLRHLVWLQCFQTMCQGLCQKPEEAGTSDRAQKQQVVLVLLKYIYYIKGYSVSEGTYWVQHQLSFPKEGNKSKQKSKLGPT